MPRQCSFYASPSKVAPAFSDVMAGASPPTPEASCSWIEPPDERQSLRSLNDEKLPCWLEDTWSEGSMMTNMPSSHSSWMWKARDAVVAMALERLNESDDRAFREPQVESEVGVVMSRWLLEFQDASFERLFSLCVASHLRHATLPAYSLMLIYSVYSLYGSVLSGHSMLILDWSTGPNVAYNLFWLSCMLATAALLAEALVTKGEHRRRKHRELGTTIFFALAVWLRCFLGNRLRVAEVMGEDPLELFGIDDGGDDELLLHTSALLVYLGMYTHIRFKLLLLPGISVALAFPISTFLTRTGRENFARQCVNTALLGTVNVFVFVGQRQIEVTRRRALLHRIEADSKARVLMQQQENARRQSRELRSYKQKQLSLFKAVEKASVQRSEQTEGTVTPTKKRRCDRSPTTDSRNSARSMSSNRAAAAAKASENARPEEQLPQQHQHTLGSDARVSSNGSLPSSVEFVDEANAVHLPNANLDAALPEGVDTDWDVVNEAVRRIRDPDYTLKEYHEHMVAAFPELGLYTFKSARSSSITGETSDEVLSSGRSRLEELARTFGAFHAVYWLMRLDMDGKQGLVFGYDDEWQMRPVLETPSIEDVRHKRFGGMSSSEKKVNFFHNFPWGECNKLLASAGLLLPPDQTGQGYIVGNDRLKAILVLTAIHDVMKNEALCPTVQAGHGPFCNYKEGQVILDHDVALDYVLSFFGNIFPSYHGLDEPSQKLVRFTQGKMGFNNGWLVQGEAPPGALFHAFKQLICSEGANSEDVAFYFAHWVTDLAGAEPTPLNGSEKFVQKFPNEVLASFFRSFPYVWQLSDMTETQVYQDYLRAQWKAQRLGALPAGDESIAILRLAQQAQGRAEQVRASFEALPRQDREVLADEMARSGLPGQAFEGLDKPRSGSPALLVYYGPAFLQKNCDRLSEAMMVLAEVYRHGRKLFPLLPEKPQDSQPDAGAGKGTAESIHVHTVTLRIEQIKDLSICELCAVRTVCLADVEAFFLTRKSDLEAVVERRPISSINAFAEEGTKFAYINAPMPLSPSPSPSMSRRTESFGHLSSPRNHNRKSTNKSVHRSSGGGASVA